MYVCPCIYICTHVRVCVCVGCVGREWMGGGGVGEPYEQD